MNTSAQRAPAHAAAPTEDESAALAELYRAFEAEHLMPLWTQIDDLMPSHPKPNAVPHFWKWSTLYPLAKRSGDLEPVGRGDQRRAIGLRNPSCGGRPYISPTLRATIQYLGPKKTAPERSLAKGDLFVIPVDDAGYRRPPDQRGDRRRRRTIGHWFFGRRRGSAEPPLRTASYKLASARNPGCNGGFHHDQPNFYDPAPK